MTKQEAQIWILENQRFIHYSQAFKAGEQEIFFKVYNTITEENKTKTACSRCLLNMRKRLQVELNKIKDYKIYNIYRTNFGQLTLKPQNKIAYQFLVKDEDELGIKLDQMKQQEKHNENDNK